MFTVQNTGSNYTSKLNALLLFLLDFLSYTENEKFLASTMCCFSYVDVVNSCVHDSPTHYTLELPNISNAGFFSRTIKEMLLCFCTCH